MIHRGRRIDTMARETKQIDFKIIFDVNKLHGEASILRARARGASESANVSLRSFVYFSVAPRPSI